jgi:hypothetical protein
MSYVSASFFVFLSFCLCSISGFPFFLCPTSLCFVSFSSSSIVLALSQSLLPLSFLPPTSSSTIRLYLLLCISLSIFSNFVSLSVSTNVSLPASFPSLPLLCLCYLSSSMSSFSKEKCRGLCQCKSAQKVTKIIRMALRVIS